MKCMGMSMRMTSDGSKTGGTSEKEQWWVLNRMGQVGTFQTASPRVMGIFGLLIMEKKTHIPVFQKLALLLSLHSESKLSVTTSPVPSWKEHFPL